MVSIGRRLRRIREMWGSLLRIFLRLSLEGWTKSTGTYGWDWDCGECVRYKSLWVVSLAGGLKGREHE